MIMTCFWWRILDSRRKSGGSFYCPNGHSLSFTETEVDRLRKQLAGKDAALVHVRDQRDAAERALKSQKGANTRLRKRIAHGVCPCCHRTFKQVSAHMDRMHPDYVAEADKP